MAEIHTLARPYADAVFEQGQADGELGRWSDALAALSAIVCNEDTVALMSNPQIDDDALADAIIAVGGDDFGPQAQNLVRLLVENSRLMTAPAIAEQFEARRAEAEQWVSVNVVSAVEFTQEQRDALTRKLEQRLSRSVRLHFEQDDSMIGGAIIRAGDLVIDGSLRAQLDRMRRSLTQ